MAAPSPDLLPGLQEALRIVIRRRAPILCSLRYSGLVDAEKVLGDAIRREMVRRNGDPNDPVQDCYDQVQEEFDAKKRGGRGG